MSSTPFRTDQSGSLVVEPFIDPPTFLGGVIESKAAAIDTARSVGTAAYAQLQLPRPTSLPKLHNRLKKKHVNSGGEDSWTIVAFENFVQGTFKVDWACDADEGAITLSFKMADDDSKAPAGFKIKQIGNSDAIATGNIWGSEEFRCSMTELKQEVLLQRIMHRIIRSHGSKLPWDDVVFPLFIVLKSR